MQILNLDGREDAYNPSTGEIVFEGGWILQSSESVLGYVVFEDDGISDIFHKDDCPDAIADFVKSMEFADYDDSVVKTIQSIKENDILCIYLERDAIYDDEDEDNFTPDWKGFIFVSIN
jgi:hypothetical protein